jgi:hypothetical protein
MQDHTLQSIADTLTLNEKIGVLLMVQMGATPQEVQFILQTADYDEETYTVTTGDTFIVRCIGVEDHRISVGLFNRLILAEEHPVLWNYNEQFRQVYFKGTPENVDGLMLELNQLYGQHYGEVRHLAQDINRMAPLETILKRGTGLLGEMARPMAEKVKALLERYGLEVNLLDSEQEEPPFDYVLLVMDDSYVIAQMFSADLMEGRGTTNQ